MDENINKSPDQGKNYENRIVPSAASVTPLKSNTSESKLRVVWCDSRLRDVWSPKLNVSEGVADDCALQYRRTDSCIIHGDRTKRAGRTCRRAGEPPDPAALVSSCNVGWSTCSRGRTRGNRRVSVRRQRCPLLVAQRAELLKCRDVGQCASNQNRTCRIVCPQGEPRRRAAQPQ